MTFILLSSLGCGWFYIKFWRDPQCEGLTLKNIFPELYNIASISGWVLLSSEPNYHWNIRFTWPIQDWELESVALFTDHIYSESWRRNGVNKNGWKLSNRAVFMFVLIIVPYNPKPKLFSVETVVETKMPPKVSFFIWTATLGKLLTIDNLRRWKVVVVDWCCMCKRNGKTIDHLFLHCLVA